jgi:hypothetical protein
MALDQGAVWREVFEREEIAATKFTPLWTRQIQSLPVLPILDSIVSQESVLSVVQRIHQVLEPVRTKLPALKSDDRVHSVAFRGSDIYAADGLVAVCVISLASNFIRVGFLQHVRWTEIFIDAEGESNEIGGYFIDTDQDIAPRPNEFEDPGEVELEAKKWAQCVKMTYSLAQLMLIVYEKLDLYIQEDAVIVMLDREVTEQLARITPLSYVIAHVLGRLLATPTDSWATVWFEKIFSAARGVAMSPDPRTPIQRTHLLYAVFVASDDENNRDASESLQLALLLTEHLYDTKVVRVEMLDIDQWPTRLINAGFRHILERYTMRTRTFYTSVPVHNLSVVDLLRSVRFAMRLLTGALPARDYEPFAIAITDEDAEEQSDNSTFIRLLRRGNNSVVGVLIVEPLTVALLQCTRTDSESIYQRCVVLRQDDSVVGFYRPSNDANTPFVDLNNVRWQNADTPGLPRPDTAISNSSVVRGGALSPILTLTIRYTMSNNIVSSLQAASYLLLASALSTARRQPGQSPEELRRLEILFEQLDAEQQRMVTHAEHAIFIVR